jgi:AAA15 family ATPase/GTPase
MLDSLLIRNYRILKELNINSLAQINLITGENNTGKSTILEAIEIYARRGDLNNILKVLEDRGEYSAQSEINVHLLSSLFTDSTIAFGYQNAIVIGNIDNSKYVTLQYVKYVDELQNNIFVPKILPDDSGNDNYKIGFVVTVDSSSHKLFTQEKFTQFGYKNMFVADICQSIRTWNIYANNAAKMFDNIILTEKERYVIEALRIIEPKIEKIAFIEDEHSRQRKAVVKLSNKTKVLPLKNMGDGINHILSIILALVNSENGFLLIDEFENGLHFRIQEQLWKMIFKLSRMLNIQVFATTHSNDCIFGFADALNSDDNTVTGKLFRLDNIKDCIKPVEYLADELQFASEHQLETR